ncbi:hypothetical protein DV096_19010 [Bradymonadaceae bacterium TMQ3]|uniref:Tetratricopeptide repeat protein n=1 Tax=Lujinxingia sediminis TaxID=2480984 RepID=A0ABY0CPK3_9DELT|nr:hypothetical protein [Lujinxingia sediminis]RDV36543.1 hypothetical protein DV096_19010 [Bradymonadaceae bacterium TMQ3]RVU42394.1 hypothetical protein EA187_16075 [Lujinxingia sediminis]TXC74593.1 hypothetical protein FRC91_15895 [Bradymonadales bacterium TMQ1]
MAKAMQEEAQVRSTRVYLELIERGIAEGECGDRGEFFEAMAALMHGDVDLATERFRHAQRHLPPPFGAMASYGLARCEVMRGRSGVAMRVFKKLATCDAPAEIRRLAWLEVEALAITRDDRLTRRKAREALDQLDGELKPVPTGTT